MAHSPVNRVLSQPCEVFWLGFRSTTYELQQAGLEIAAEQDINYGRARLLLRHSDLRLYAISAYSNFDFYRALNEYSPPPIFHVTNCAARMEIMRMHEMGNAFMNFKQIDAMPQISQAEIKSIDDLGIFATPLVRTEEIIVDPTDVFALLEQIKKMQSPVQAEIRQRERLRQSRDSMNPDAGQRQKFHAQIISLSDYKEAA